MLLKELSLEAVDMAQCVSAGAIGEVGNQIVFDNPGEPVIGLRNALRNGVLFERKKFSFSCQLFRNVESTRHGNGKKRGFHVVSVQ